MLGKLLKYEIKATARWFLPLYAGILVFSLFNRLLLLLESNFHQDRPSFIGQLFELISRIAVFLYVITILATFLLTFFLMIQRFYKNLLGDEGYLMFTLPVSPAKHIWTKLITSIFWFFISCIVTIFSILVLTSGFDLIQNVVFEMMTFLQGLTTYDGIQVLIILIEIFITIFISIANYDLMFYASIALGHTHKSHKILYSFAYLMLLNVLSQIFSFVVILVGGFLFDSQFASFLFDQFENSIPYNFFHFLMGSNFLITLITGTTFYLVTNHALTKRLNLE